MTWSTERHTVEYKGADLGGGADLDVGLKIDLLLVIARRRRRGGLDVVDGVFVDVGLGSCGTCHLPDGAFEHLVDLLERQACGLGQEERVEGKSEDQRDGSVEGKGARSAHVRVEHGLQRPRRRELEQIVHGHDERRGDTSHVHLKDLGAHKVLSQVATGRETGSGQEDGGEGSLASRLFALGVVALHVETEEDGNVEHGETLDQDTAQQRLAAAKQIDQEEGGQDTTAKLGGTEADRHDVAVLVRGAYERHDAVGIRRNGTGTTPLDENLNHDAESDLEHVLAAGEDGVELEQRVAAPVDRVGGKRLLALGVTRVLFGDRGTHEVGLLDHRRVVLVEVAVEPERAVRLLDVSVVEQPSRRLVDEEGADEEHGVPEDGKDEHDLPHDVVAPVLGARRSQVDGVAEHGAEVDGSTVDRRAETSDLTRSGLDEEDGGADRGDADTDTGHHAGDVEQRDAFGAAHPHGAADDDERAAQATGHDTAELVRDGVADQGTECGEELDHGYDVGLLGGLLLDVEGMFEGWSTDGSGDDTFVHASTGTEQAHGEHCEQQAPVHRLRRHLMDVTQLGRHPSLVGSFLHCVDGWRG
ncbi:hypothetical protein L1887_48224 [Cichorium endivia]|nr:hypothetical protein L1887_48224 [Cichorium endivia]